MTPPSTAAGVDRATAAPSAQAKRRPERGLRWVVHLIPYLRPYRLQMLGALAALTVAAGTVLALGNGLRILIDEGFGGGGQALHDDAIIAMFIVAVVLAAATFARFYLVSLVGESVVADLRRAVFDHVLKLSPGFYEVTPAGEIISRLTTDTTVLQTVVGSSVSVALRNLLLLVGGTVMLLITSPKLTGLVALVVPLVVVPILLFGRRVRQLSRASQDRVADISSYADETLHAVGTVQAFGHEAADRARFGERVGGALATAVERIRARAWLTAIVILLVFGAISVILWIGGHDVLAGRISPGELSAFIFYAIVVAGALGAVSEVAAELQRAAGATERIVELLAEKPEIVAPADPVPLPEPARGAIDFQAVRFRYPSRPDWASLDGFDLAVRPGEMVAIVGPSGAGKTTVFRLLLRLYDPQEGAVRLDGVDVRTADPAAVRARIGLVPQEPVIFSASALDNIRYGRPDAPDEAVRAAAAAAHAVEFIERLPQGYDTPLGERGVRLSGGQRQRIAIARAVLRDPKVLLLDEATNALDAESERVVQDALDRLAQGRTTLVIAHRLATVLRADRIVVMDQGRIVAMGTHGELMAQGGLYARLAALQFDQQRAPAQPPGALGLGPAGL